MEIIQLPLWADKRCPQCDAWKSPLDFGKHAGNADGLQVHCRECRKAYYRARSEKPKAWAKAWREAHQEAKRKAGREHMRRKLAREREWQKPKTKRPGTRIPSGDRRALVRPVALYQIYCTANETVYVGRATNVRNRWGHHRRLLRMGEHNNQYLQHAWVKYGEPVFKFELLNIVGTEQEADEAERLWIAIFKQSGVKLFNLTDGGEGFLGHTWTADAVERIAAKNRGQKRTTEQRIRIAQAHTGGRRFSFIAPDGTIYRDIESLSLFAEQHGLKSYSLSCLVTGRTKQHRGWKLDGDPSRRHNLRSGGGRDSYNK